LKGITDSTGCSIQIPRDDELSTSEDPTSTANDQEGSTDDSEEDLGPLISISLSGPTSAVESARSQILSIVRERTSKTTTSLNDIPSEFWIFLGSGNKIQELIEKSVGIDEKENVNVYVPRRLPPGGKRGVDVEEAANGSEDGGEKKEEKSVKVTGDKELVKKVVQSIHEEVNELVR